MVRVIISSDPKGDYLVVGVKRKDTWIKHQVRIESFWGPKCLARILRELADSIERSKVPDG